jgi:hypothetical protein
VIASKIPANQGQSVRTYFLLLDMLLIEHKQKEIKSQDKFTLGEF